MTENDENEETDRPRIVVGLDSSPSSKDALRWAARQAELTGASLEVVTTWEFPTAFGWAPPYPENFDPGRDASQSLDEAIEEVLGTAPRVKVRTKVVEGHPAPVLVALSRGADLLVVGSRGHGEFAGMLLGSVSEHCVTNAHCPVLVLREGPGT
jgi:nucleotide-binding universal stress UspA family protein